MSVVLHTSQMVALQACVQHGDLRRTREGYRPSAPGNHEMHSSRAVFALEREGFVRATEGSIAFAPTDAGCAHVTAHLAAQERKAA